MGARGHFPKGTEKYQVIDKLIAQLIKGPRIGKKTINNIYEYFTGV